MNDVTQQYLCDVNYWNRVTTAFLGVKQEGLAIVNFLNKLIVSYKEAVRIPIFFVIFKLDSYFLF